MLGHADVKTTSTYLNVHTHSLQESMRRFGTARLHDVAPAPDSEHRLTGNTPAAGDGKSLPH
jgi:hypothetical protein